MLALKKYQELDMQEFSNIQQGQQDWGSLCYYVLAELKKIQVLDNNIREVEKDLVELKAKIAMWSAAIAIGSTGVVQFAIRFFAN